MSVFKDNIFCVFYKKNDSLLSILNLWVSTPSFNLFTIIFAYTTLSLLYRVSSPRSLLLLSYTAAILFCYLGYEFPNSYKLLPDFSNSLLSNTLILVHPPLLYASLTLTILILKAHLLFACSTNPARLFYNKGWLGRLNNLSMLSVMCLITSLLLGGFWANQMSTWGGWWVWDSSETLLLVLLTLEVLLLHFKNTKFSFTGKLLLTLTASSVLFTFWFVNFLVLSSSLHSFFSDEFNFFKKKYLLLVPLLLYTTYPYSFVLYQVSLYCKGRVTLYETLPLLFVTAYVPLKTFLNSNYTLLLTLPYVITAYFIIKKMQYNLKLIHLVALGLMLYFTINYLSSSYFFCNSDYVSINHKPLVLLNWTAGDYLMLGDGCLRKCVTFQDLIFVPSHTTLTYLDFIRGALALSNVGSSTLLTVDHYSFIFF